MKDGPVDAAFGSRSADDEVAAALPIVVVGSSDGQSFSCGGLFVHSLWILTAAHCVDVSGQGIGAIVRPERAGNPAVLAFVQQVVVYPGIDVALLRIEPQPDAIATLHLSKDARQYLQRTGFVRVFGPRSAGGNRARWFASEQIVALTPSTLTGRVTSASGPCVGDSGGPLIVQEAGGIATVAGVLSEGSMSCQQTDVFERADVIADWVAHVLASPPLDDGRWRGSSSGMRCLSGPVRGCVYAGGGLGVCGVHGRARLCCELGQLATEEGDACDERLALGANVATDCAIGLAEYL